MEQVSAWRSHGGTQGVYTHQSASTGTPINSVWRSCEMIIDQIPVVVLV